MVVEAADILLKLGDLALYLQALGVIIILWIVFQVIALLLNRNRIKEIHIIKEEMKIMDKKLDKIIAHTGRHR
ncbi:MAG: hypothetical protein WCK90_01085 [archaeon]